VAHGVRRLLALGVALALALEAAAAGEPPAAPPGTPRSFDPRRPPERELEMSIADGFTLAAVGDCIISRPLSQLLKRDAAFAAVAAIVKGADATFGNFENVAFDVRGFKGSPHGAREDWALVAAPEVARDLKTMGFDLLARANNHAMDWGVEGMRETARWLDEAGLVHAGAGENRAEARAARYLETESGRVGLVSMVSSFTELLQALPPHGQAPGRPGVNALRTTRYTVVPPEMMRTLASLRGTLEASLRSCNEFDAERGKAPSAGGAGAPPAELTLFDTRFRLGERLGYHYEIDPVDLAENLQAIRLGKQHSDFLIATIHAHESGLSCDEPGDFLPALAHAALDAGADAFLGHGIHRLGPIEVYKGKPIFYGLGNFFWSDIQEPIPADLHERYRDLVASALGDPSKATDADLSALLNAAEFDDEVVFQTIVAVSRFQGGRLAEIRLHPVDLGYGRRLTESGVPRLASPRAARAILERLQRLSSPFGTTIGIEQNVGVIRFR